MNISIRLTFTHLSFWLLANMILWIFITAIIKPKSSFHLVGVFKSNKYEFLVSRKVIVKQLTTEKKGIGHSVAYYL